MLNLLNKEKRFFLRREYFGRLTNVILSVIIFCLVFYGILLLSNSFLVNFEKIAVEIEFQNLAQSNLQKDLEIYEKNLAHIQAEYNLFSKKSTEPTLIISKIEQKQVPGIVLKSINFQKVDEEGGAKLQVGGLAKDRDTLINYSDSLKTENIFQEINIPLATFAKDSNIPFSLSINTKINLKNEN
jgi:hypothetical protein